MRGRPAEFGDHRRGHRHGHHIVGVGGRPSQDHRFTPVRAFFGFAGIGDDEAAGDTRTSWFTGCHGSGRIPLAAVEPWGQQGTNLLGCHPVERFTMSDQAGLSQQHRVPDRRLRGAFGGPRLQQPQCAALHREFDILHVPGIGLQPGRGGEQLGVHIRHGGGQLREREGVGAAGHHILTLATRQPLTVWFGTTGERVTGEQHAGSRTVVEIAENHRLHGDRGPGIV